MLIADLRSLGFEFDSGNPYSEVPANAAVGYVDTRKHTLLGHPEEKIWTHTFVGPTEALMAASRYSLAGDSFEVPGSAVVGEPGPRGWNLFVEGNVLATHSGDLVGLTDALAELMGEPFAGSRAYGLWDDPESELNHPFNVPEFKDLWLEQAPEVRNVRVETQYVGRNRDILTAKIFFDVHDIRSAECGFGRHYERETVGDEVVVTVSGYVLNTDKFKLVADCDLGREWQPAWIRAQDLVPGFTYTVSVNGREFAEFTAIAE